MSSGHKILRPAGSTDDIHIEWRAHICCWAAWHAKQLPGDFVECGVNTGIMSLAVCNFIDFNSTNKRFFLFDTFRGIPEEQMLPSERQARMAQNESYYEECYELAKSNFASFPRAVLVRGTIPTTLSAAPIDEICCLHLDMNIAYPEMAAVEHFWGKLVRGAPVIWDDYGFVHYEEQKRAMDEFAARKGVKIATLPTGQGLLIKACSPAPSAKRQRTLGVESLEGRVRHADVLGDVMSDPSGGGVAEQRAEDVLHVDCYAEVQALVRRNRRILARWGVIPGLEADHDIREAQHPRHPGNRIEMKGEHVRLAAVVLEEVDVPVVADGASIVLRREVLEPEVDQAIDLGDVDHQHGECSAGDIGDHVTDLELVDQAVLELREGEEHLRDARRDDAGLESRPTGRGQESRRGA